MKHTIPSIEQGQIDWLGVAIAGVGAGHARPGEHCIQGASRALKVPQKTIGEWLEHGLDDAPFSTVVKLSELGDVPLVYLARRLGPWQEAKRAA